MTKLSPSTRELLDRAKWADGPPARSKARIYRALNATAAASAVTLGATAAEAALSVSAKSSGLLTLLTTGKASIVAATAVGMMSGSLIVASVNHFHPPTATPISPRTAIAPLAPKPLSTTRTARVAPATLTLPDLPLEIEAAKPAPAPAPSNAVSIAEEARLLAQVQQALREGNGQRALLLLGRYRRDFVSGALSEEAAAAEVFARCAVGDTAGTARARARFRQQFAGSPLEPRVEASCPHGGVDERTP